MLGMLIKKQFTELFRGFVYDQRKGRLRSKGATIGFILLYAVLIIGFVGGMFMTMASALCAPLAEQGFGWLYYAVMALLGLVLGVFGSVFSTYSSLYLAKDNDQLLSLPIPVRQILVSRLLGVYLMGLIFSGAATVPAVIVYLSTVGVTASAIVGGLLYVLLISLIVMILSCALGWVVAKFSIRFKNKSYLTVILSLVVIAVYYYFYFRAQEMLRQLIANAGALSDRLGGGWNPIYLAGRGAEGELVRILPPILAALVLFLLVWILLEKSFLKIATASGGAAKVKYKGGALHAHGVGRALLGRELRHFTSNPNYMLNCGLGILFLVIAAAALLWKGELVLDALGSVFANASGALPVLAAGALCLIDTMNDITAPSVSLEGKSIWIVQSLPVTARQALFAKLNVQLVLTAPPTALCAVCAAVALRLDFLSALLVLLTALLFCGFTACVGLWLNLRRPNLSWTNEIVPIKQSFGVLLTILIGWAYVIAFVGVYMLALAESGFGAPAYLLLICLVTAVLDALLLRWISRRGAAIFEEL